MASGCAIVSTIPLGYEGALVKPGNVDQMVKAIHYLIGNPEIAARMGEQNVMLSKKYTWDNFTKKLIGLYKELLKEGEV
jgi:glycosyltransferase involved in cell wall biosynthesis